MSSYSLKIILFQKQFRIVGAIFLLILFTGILLSIIISNVSLLKAIFILFGLIVVLLIFLFPELGLVLSYSSGIFKEWLTENVFLFTSFDFTIAIFGLTLISIIFSSIRKGTIYEFKFHKSFIPLLIFTIILLVSILYTPTFKYGAFKAFSFLVFNWSLFFLPIISITQEKELWRFISFLTLLGTIVAAFTILNIILGIISGDIIFSYRASFLEVNVILFSTWMASICVFLIAAFPIIKKKLLKIAAIVSLVLMLTAMLIANSRGPMFSFILVSLLIMGVRWNKNNRKKIIVALLAIIVVLTIIIAILPEQLTNRYFDLIQQDQSTKAVANYTVNSRLSFWERSLELGTENISNFLFGVGIGGFSREYLHVEYLRIYPHNIFLEVFCELGFFATAFLIWFFFSILMDSVKLYIMDLSNEQKYLLFSFMAVTLFTLLAAQLSGDLNDNRRIWLFLGIIISIFNLYKMQTLRNKTLPWAI